MDVYDRAAILELDEWERRQAAAIRPAPTATSALVCEDCGEPIPEPRRRASPGCTRCIECQQLREEHDR